MLSMLMGRRPSFHGWMLHTGSHWDASWNSSNDIGNISDKANFEQQKQLIRLLAHLRSQNMHFSQTKTAK
jgi:hypothetical protein